MPQDGLGVERWHPAVAARLLDLNADLACTASFDGFFTEVSGDWTGLLGFSAAELTSRPLLDFVHPDDVAETARQLEGAREGRDIASFENRFLHKDGESRWLLWTAVGIPHESSYCAVARDLTPRHRNICAPGARVAEADQGRRHANAPRHGGRPGRERRRSSAAPKRAQARTAPSTLAPSTLAREVCAIVAEPTTRVPS